MALTTKTIPRYVSPENANNIPQMRQNRSCGLIHVEGLAACRLLALQAQQDFRLVQRSTREMLKRGDISLQDFH